MNPKIPSPDKDVTYSTYLKVKELVSLQQPLSEPVAHDEMLFIIIHQVYELWFKLVIFEIQSFIQSIEGDNLISGFHIMKRISEIFRVLIQQLDILETMTPTDFNKFRSKLNPASGFQSLQFRELEIICGADIKEYDKFSPLEPEWKPKLKELSQRANLHTTFVELIKRRGLVKSETPEAFRDALLAVYEDDKHSELRALCEHLIGFDEQISLWRFRHVQMVERMIGMKKGTGGSLGVNYLKQTLSKKFFPELWDLRTFLTGDLSY